MEIIFLNTNLKRHKSKAANENKELQKQIEIANKTVSKLTAKITPYWWNNKKNSTKQTKP